MTYYNDNDPKCAAWLRELIKDDLIPAGDVDDRPIEEVKPHELSGYSQQHFFAGIGGWAYALRLAGWPDDEPVRTGSCPCQPFSQAGKGKGEEDKRHLWPTFRDLIAFGEPTITFGEQVASPLGRVWLSRVRADLEALGYAVGAADLCAAGVSAPHIRQRLYWMANPVHGRTPRHASEREHKSGSEFGPRLENGGMADTRHQSTRRRTRPAEENSRRAYSQSSGRSAISGLGDPDGERREGFDALLREEGARRDETDIPEATGDGSTSWLGEPNQQRLEGWSERLAECPYQWPVGSPNLVVRCRDGAWRRFKPGAFPLAHGIPGRMVKLRGAGNAIVPELAAMFIKAAIEAIR